MEAGNKKTPTNDTKVIILLVAIRISKVSFSPHPHTSVLKDNVKKAHVMGCMIGQNPNLRKPRCFLPALCLRVRYYLYHTKQTYPLI